MAIANELSSEVAAALLESFKQEELSSDAGDIMYVIVEVHSTLRKLKAGARRASGQLSQASFKSDSGTSAASGSH